MRHNLGGLYSPHTYISRYDSKYSENLTVKRTSLYAPLAFATFLSVIFLIVAAGFVSPFIIAATMFGILLVAGHIPVMVRHHEDWKMERPQQDLLDTIDNLPDEYRKSFPKDYHSRIKSANHNTVREWQEKADSITEWANAAQRLAAANSVEQVAMTEAFTDALEKAKTEHTILKEMEKMV